MCAGHTYYRYAMYILLFVLGDGVVCTHTEMPPCERMMMRHKAQQKEVYRRTHTRLMNEDFDQSAFRGKQSIDQQ